MAWGRSSPSGAVGGERGKDSRVCECGGPVMEGLESTRRTSTPGVGISQWAGHLPSLRGSDGTRKGTCANERAEASPGWTSGSHARPADVGLWETQAQANDHELKRRRDVSVTVGVKCLAFGSALLLVAERFRGVVRGAGEARGSGGSDPGPLVVRNLEPWS